MSDSRMKTDDGSVQGPILLLLVVGAWLCVAAQVHAQETHRGDTLQREPEIFRARVVNTFPHDPQAYTQGLFWHAGHLYESTGKRGASSLRRVALETGEVTAIRPIDDALFGEGAVQWGDRIISLTWQAGMALVHSLETLEPVEVFSYEGEGWGLTSDGAQLIMSDGTPVLRFIDPERFSETGTLTVTLNGRPIRNLNELEWVNDRIYANLWQTDYIAIIDPDSGVVDGLIDLSDLLTPKERAALADEGEGRYSTLKLRNNVLNGIAYNTEQGRLFVTGKNWPKLFEIELYTP